MKWSYQMSINRCVKKNLIVLFSLAMVSCGGKSKNSSHIANSTQIDDCRAFNTAVLDTKIPDCVESVFLRIRKKTSRTETVDLGDGNTVTVPIYKGGLAFKQRNGTNVRVTELEIHGYYYNRGEKSPINRMTEINLLKKDTELEMVFPKNSTIRAFLGKYNGVFWDTDLLATGYYASLRNLRNHSEVKIEDIHKGGIRLKFGYTWGITPQIDKFFLILKPINVIE